jgi:flagellar biosynthesis protein
MPESGTRSKAFVDSTQRVSALAEKFHIPLPEDAGVITALSRLDSNEAVPTELYSLIASVLAFVHRVDAKLPLT